MRTTALSLLLPFLVSVAEGVAIERRTSNFTSIPQVISVLSSVVGAAPSGTPLLSLGNAYSAAGISLQAFPPATLLDGPSPGVDSYNNTNPRNPAQSIYPKKSPSDAPYSLTEQELRAAIYIPSTFQYGQGPAIPILCVPGSGVYGSTYYYYTNLAKYLAATSLVDPVWLNVPDHFWGDAQVNSEYVAYAINYIAGISKGQTAILSWSQGGADAQWSFKYWPSTRSVTTDHIAMSPGYHGTLSASVSGLAVPVPPGLNQQDYTSKFVGALRSDGGDSAYVPTTVVYSGTDQIIEPQQGTGASAYLLDTRNVGVSNNYLQGLCPLQPAGTFVTHEGVGFNPVTFALIQDAVTHSGPGETSRIDLTSLCKQYAASVFTLTDVVNFGANIVFAVTTAGTYEGQRYILDSEPPLMAYAAWDDEQI